MRKFNTTGPCFPDEHYMLPALDRLPGIRELVAGGNYFVIHAPRQTGKTTALKALVREINEKGEMFAVYCTLETLQNRSDPEKTNIAIRDLIADNVEMSPFYGCLRFTSLSRTLLPSGLTVEGLDLPCERCCRTPVVHWGKQLSYSLTRRIASWAMP